MVAGAPKVTEPLNIVVYGLWHLGCVTAAALANEGFSVVGLDSNLDVIADLQSNRPPIFEPGLAELIADSQASGRLSFTTDYQRALCESNVLWVTFDTTVDEKDRADVDLLQQQLDAAFSYIKTGTTVIISSQVPVGFTDSLRERWQDRGSSKDLVFCYTPENLRLGKALQSFRPKDRIIVGLDGERSRFLIEDILTRFCPRLEWMSIRSAEMTKHALNAFLATSVAMINEIARICERTGADAKEVERGLKTESRIGQQAYVAPGGPFAGGTLARDVGFLVRLGAQCGVETPLLSGVLSSNELQKNWVRETTSHLLQDVAKPGRVAVLGVTYKAGTDTLRRSESLSLGQWLVEQGAEVVFHDPVVTQFPLGMSGKIHLTNDLNEALTNADLLILGTDWPIYRQEVNPKLLSETMRRVAVIDQNRFLAGLLEGAPGVKYAAVGKPWSHQK